MDRRSALAAIGTAAIAGCLSDGSDSDLDDDHESDDRDRDDQRDDDTLEDELSSVVHELGSAVEYDVVLIETRRFEVADSVEYRHPEDAEIKAWDPGEDMAIVVTGHWVENLSNESLDYPAWDQFELVTPDGTYDPTLETPDGVSVDEIRDPRVSWPESEGHRPSYSRGWSGVYVAPMNALENYAVRWTFPEDPIYWGGVS